MVCYKDGGDWNRQEEIDCTARFNIQDESLTEAIVEFLFHLRATGCARSTIECYLRELNILATDLGDIQLSHVTAKNLENTLVRRGMAGFSDITLSPVTMNRIKSAYRSFFRWAQETGRTPSNPAACLRLAKTKTHYTPPISPEEVNRLLTTIVSSDDPLAGRDMALFSVYAFSGVRRAEALGLCMADYDPNLRILNIRHGKGGQRRTQPVPERLAKILGKYIVRLLRHHRLHEDSPLFPGRHPDRPLSVRQANERFDKWKRLAKIRRRITIHSFRTGFATALYGTTRDLLLVAHALGHRDIRTTEKYIAPHPAETRMSIEAAFPE